MNYLKQLNQLNLLATTANITTNLTNMPCACITCKDTTTGYIWTQWVQQSYTTTVGMVHVFPGQSTTINTITYGDAVWSKWNKIREELGDLHASVAPYVPRKKTEDEIRQELIERQRQLQAEREWRAQEDLRLKTAKEAAKKADALLRRHLTEEQKRDLAEKGCFYVDLENGRRYRIDYGSHGNVYRVDKKGSIEASVCVQPNGVPAGDCMLAQKLWLESDETALLKIANVTPWNRHERPVPGPRAPERFGVDPG